MMQCVHITCHKTIFIMFCYHQVPRGQFVIFQPQLVYPPDKALSGVIFNPLSYPRHWLEGVAIFPTYLRFREEFLSSGNKFNYITRLVTTCHKTRKTQ